MPHSPVNLITGPARSGKTERALAHYAAALDRWRGHPCGPPHYWIGPTPAALSDVRDRLAARAQGSWLNPRVVTFATLAQEIISRGSRRVRPICGLEKQRILWHVVQHLLAAGQLKHFGAVASTPGFLRQVSATIADLKRRDIWADEFRDRSLTPRDRDFATIYAEYQEHLSRHQLFDTEGRFWAAREELEANSASLPRKRGESRFGLVVLDGFADFTAAQHDLLRLLAQHSEELVITLPADAEPADRTLLFDKPRRTLEQLEKSFPQLCCESVGASHYGSAGLSVVEQNIFSDDAQLSDVTDGLAIVAANGVHGEIREVARRVKELLFRGAARPDDIAVVFPSLDELAPRIREIFDDFGLPVALDHRTRLNATPLARGIAKLLRLAVEDWPFDLLLDVVGSHLVALSFGEGNSRSAIERCIRRAQLPAGRLLLLEQLGEWASHVPADPTAEVSAERLRLVEESQVAWVGLRQLDAALSDFTASAPLSEWMVKLEHAVSRVGMLTPAHEDVWRLLKKQCSLVVAVDATLKASDTIAARKFLELIERVGSETFLPQSTDTVGRVRVMAAESARNLSIKHLFLAGLSEQSYSSAEGVGSIYREAEIQRFDDAGPAENLAEQQSGEAMLLFYDMVTRASDTLTLSYPALDDKGQALTPSPFLTELERCFAPQTISTTVVPIGGAWDLESPPASRSDWRTHGMVAALDGKQQWLAGLVSADATRSLGRAILRSVESVASRAKRETFGPYEGVVLGSAAGGAISRHFGPAHLWSASQLETYAVCPYQFFARQVLRLEPLDDIALRSDHLRKGHLLHQVLAAIHTQAPEPGGSLDDKQLIERFTAALEQAIEQTPLKGLEAALREIERREIHSWAPLYSEQELAYRRRWEQLDEPLVPVYFEVRFGPKSRSGNTASDAASMEVPFVLDLGNEQIKLTGQIDRIDMGRVGGVSVFNIIDYKSGKKVNLSVKEIESGTQLQLPLYALAAEKLLFADRKAVALATSYWSIQSGGFAPGRDALLQIRTQVDGGLTDSPDWGRLEGSIKKKVAEIVRGVRSAHFPIYSEKKDCTNNCDFSKICRIAQVRSLEKVWSADSSGSDVNTKSET